MSSMYYMQNSHNFRSDPSVPIYSDYLNKVTTVPWLYSSCRNNYVPNNKVEYWDTQPATISNSRRELIPISHNLDTEYETFDHFTGMKREWRSREQYPRYLGEAPTFVGGELRTRFNSSGRPAYLPCNWFLPIDQCRHGVIFDERCPDWVYYSPRSRSPRWNRDSWKACSSHSDIYLQHPYYDERHTITIKKSPSEEELWRQWVDDNCKASKPKEESTSKIEFTMTPAKRSKFGKNIVGLLHSWIYC